MRRSQRDEEFEEFVSSTWPRLRRAAYLLCQDTHEADDLVQSALASCYVRWAKVRREDAFAYVRRSLVNTYIDTTRRRRPTPVDTGPVAADRGQRTAPDHSVEDRSELVDLLAPLSPRERSIIVWRYYLDAPEAEVAERLGVSTGTVKSTASRALARLRSAATVQPGSGGSSPDGDPVRFWTNPSLLGAEPGGEYLVVGFAEGTPEQITWSTPNGDSGPVDGMSTTVVDGYTVFYLSQPYPEGSEPREPDRDVTHGKDGEVVLEDDGGAQDFPPNLTIHTSNGWSCSLADCGSMG